MKRVIAISLLHTILFSYTELYQLFALPTLFEHYMEHKQENKNVTFLDYLSQHYVGKINHTHNDNHRDHEKLPFKTCGMIHVFVAFVNHTQFSVLSPLVFQEIVFSIYNGGNYLSTFQENIWQPPKIS